MHALLNPRGGVLNPRGHGRGRARSLRQGGGDPENGQAPEKDKNEQREVEPERAHENVRASEPKRVTNIASSLQRINRDGAVGRQG